MLQVDHASHFDRDIPQRYPASAELVGSGAQINQVVVAASAVVLARVVETDELALVQVRLSLQKLLVEGPETGHGAKILVFLRTDDLKERLRAARKNGREEILLKVQNDVAFKKTF